MSQGEIIAASENEATSTGTTDRIRARASLHAASAIRKTTITRTVDSGDCCLSGGAGCVEARAGADAIGGAGAGRLVLAGSDDLALAHSRCDRLSSADSN